MKKAKRSKKRKYPRFRFVAQLGEEQWEFNPLVKLPVLKAYLQNQLFSVGEVVEVTVRHYEE